MRFRGGDRRSREETCRSWQAQRAGAGADLAIAGVSWVVIEEHDPEVEGNELANRP
jgi:hypothetical protein